MKIKTRYIGLPIVLALTASCALPALAQKPETTPRQDFIAFISGEPVSDLKFKPLGDTPDEPVLGYTVPEKPPAPSKPEPEEVDDEPPGVDVPQAPTAQETVAEVSSIEPEHPPETPKTTQPTKPKLLPFYVTASDYLASRDNEAQTITLTYSVSAANKKSGITVPPRTQKIIIGPDYAASVRDEETRIYDFRKARVLIVRTDGNESQFENTSLYATAYKNVDTIKKATRSGKLSAIKIGPDLSLDSFWLEAGLGWTARTEFEMLSAERKGAKVEAVYDGKTIATLDLSGPELPSEAHMRALFAFWHHDTAIHPAILPGIGRPERAAKSMAITSYSPNVPGGVITTWTLTEGRTARTVFPLPANAKSVLQNETVSPLAFVIAGAADGSALPDRLSLDQLRNDLHEQREAGKDFEAWISGKILADRLGGCSNDPALLCQDIDDLAANAEPGSDLEKLSKAVELSKSKATRAKAFAALLPYIDGEIAPAFLVKLAGQTRSRIRSKDLTPETRARRADSLLEEALAKNPYDPDIYKSLAQVYAAQGRFAESWDIYDSMRALPDVPDTLTAPINRAEASIKTRAPGYFAPLTP